MKFLFTYLLFIFLSFDSYSQTNTRILNKKCDKSMMSFTSFAFINFSEVKIINDGLKIKIGIVENCETNFYFNSFLTKNQDTCYINYFNKLTPINKDLPVQIYLETYSSCDCYFSIDLFLDSIQKQPSVILLKNSTDSLFKDKSGYEIVHFSKTNGLPMIPKKIKSKNLNQKDINGNKIGIWKTETEKYIVFDNYYEHTIGKTISMWKTFINKKNGKKNITITNRNHYIELSDEEYNLMQRKIKSLLK